MKSLLARAMQSNTGTMHTTPLPRRDEPSRPRFETQPEPPKREEQKTVDPEPHWELIIDAATD
jgi:hypothetical protein